MHIQIDTTPALYPIKDVIAIAAKMQEFDDEGWTYTPDYDPTGQAKFARIAVHDEDGEFVTFSTIR